MSTPPLPPASPKPSTPPLAPAPKGKRPPRNTSKFVLGIIAIVGGGLILLALLIATVLFFALRKDSNKDKTDKDVDSTEQVIASDIPEAEEEDIEFSTTEVIPEGEPVAANSYLPPNSYHASGYLSDLPCSLDFTVDENGSVSGTFWNIFYDIKLQVSGNVDSLGNLSLDLGSGSSLSHMDLSGISGSNRFSGSWGKNQKPISLSVYTGSRSSALSSQSGTAFKIEGGGMTTHGHISHLGGDRYKLTFDNQPEVNALPCTLSGYYFNIYSPDNSTRIAYFPLNDEGTLSPASSTLYICNGKEFTITII